MDDGLKEEGLGPAIVPAGERVVDFYGDPIPIAQAQEGEVYVPIWPITDFLGLASGPQRRRIMRDDVMAERVRLVQMMGGDGKRRELMCLPLDLLPGWLFGLTPARTKPDLADKLKRYRAELGWLERTINRLEGNV